MAKSLQEQLLESGLAKPKQAKKARREKAQKGKAARQQGGQPAEDQALGREIAAAQAAKRRRDRELNERQKTQRAAREREAAIVQIIETNRVATGGQASDAVAYNYTVEKRIRRIDVSDAQRRELAAGRLGIVRYRGVSSLVPRATAERLRESIPDRVWLVTPNDEPPDPEDPYADYPVPDDLMW